MKNEKNNFFIIFAIAFCIVFSGNIYSSIKSYKYRRHLDTVRNELVRAKEYNRKLAERFGSISANVQKLGELADRNVNGIRECIEIIEETRVITKEMEDSCGSFNQLEYYEHWDNEFGISE